jgi:hypothetical protein
MVPLPVDGSISSNQEFQLLRTHPFFRRDSPQQAKKTIFENII